MSNVLNTIYINVEMLGSAATDSDVSKMVELLREKGWNAVASSKTNDLTSEHPERQEYFDRDFAACLQML